MRFPNAGEIPSYTGQQFNQEFLWMVLVIGVITITILMPLCAYLSFKGK